VDVSAQLKQVLVAFHDSRAVPTVDQMPDPVVTKILISGIPRLNIVHEPTQVSFWSFEHEVNMVTHETEHVEADFVQVHAFAESLLKTPPITVVAKDGSSLVPAHGDVVNCPFVFQS
jgi:hypothetical protein